MSMEPISQRHIPELRQLLQVVAVVDTGSIAAAARVLGVAQPALSRRLRALEDRLGYALFRREGSGSRPTDAGLALADGARTLIEARDRILLDARRRANGESGTLRISFNETVSWGGVVPDAIRRFRIGHPDVQLVALPMNSATSQAAILEERVDLGFMFGRPDTDPAFQAIFISRQPVMLAVHRDDPLARLPEPIDLRALSGSALIWFDRADSPVYHDQMLAALAHAGVASDPIQTTTNTSAMLALVNAGSGYSFVPVAASVRKPVEVQLMTLARPDLDQHLELVWRTDDETALTAKFVECVRAVLAEASTSK